MNILAFAGSNSSKSINLKLVRHVLDYLPEHESEVLDLNGYEVPIYSADRQDNDGCPDKILQFRKKIGDCDCIIVSLAEHNRSYSAAFKNIFDWASRVDINIFHNKPMLLMSTSPGGYGGGNVMNAAKSFFLECGADIIETFSLPSFYQNFDEAQGIMQPELKAAFETKVNAFKLRIGK